MRIDRREFIRLASAAGLCLLGPTGQARAQDEMASRGSGAKRRWVFVHAGGGWDPTSLCDPKGRRTEEDESPLNLYFTDDIGEAGNLRYAPVAWNQEFFERHYRRTLVLNGVDTQTNNHDAGVRHTWSGKLSEGYPSLAALIAGALDRELPMAFVSNGGYDFTGGLVAPTRTGNIDALNRIAHPNAIDGNRPDGERFHTAATQERILAAQLARRARLEARHDLPRARASIEALFSARVGRNEVKRLSEYLPTSFENDALQRQAQVACAAFKSGLARTANLSMGGFDTHGNHDDSHYPRLATLMQGVDFLWTEAERQGIADELVVVVGSDFGRTPGYNDGRGKDHWSITSVLLMGDGIPGNKVIGVTDERHRPIVLDPATLQPKDGGIRVEPRHIHHALRVHAGVAETEAARARYPLIGVEPLPLLRA